MSVQNHTRASYNSRICPCNGPRTEKCKIIINYTVKFVTPYVKATWSKGTELAHNLCAKLFEKKVETNIRSSLPSDQPLSEPNLLTDKLSLITKPIHREVEFAPFFQKILAGKINTGAYLQYLVNLLPVYETLENALRNLPENSPFNILCIPELERTIKLSWDIDVLKFVDECSFLKLKNYVSSKSAEDYATYLKQISHTKPHLLIAHAYVRYLGDLAGGQILKLRINNLCSKATNFYDFEDLTSSIKKRHTKTSFYKSLINSIKLTPIQQNEVLQEALVAYTKSGLLIPKL